MKLHPDFPVVSGLYRITKEWSLELPMPLNRRIEDGSMVLWRPGFTVWLEPWGNDNEESQAERYGWLKGDLPSDAYDVKEGSSGGILRISYRLNEESDDERRDALYGFAVGSDGHLQVSFYFNDPEYASIAEQILASASCAAL